MISGESTELVLVSAADDAALVREMTRLIDFIDRVPDVPLVDVAYTCSLMKGDSVIALIVSTAQELRDRLFSARSRLETGTAVRLKDKSGTYYLKKHLIGGENGGKLAFIYPGAMSFYPDMLRDVAIASPECRQVFDELEEAMKDEPDFTPSNFIFPPAAYYRHDADIFSSGAYAQALVSVFAGSMAFTRMLNKDGIIPDGVVGCVGGDLAAAMRAGAAGRDVVRSDRMHVISDIYHIVDRAIDHAGLKPMSVFSLVLKREGEADAVLASLDPNKVTLVNDYSPRWKVVAVEPDYEVAVADAFAAAGIRAMKLEMDRPFNTTKCESVVTAIRKFTADWMKYDAICDVYSCALAEKLPVKVKSVRGETAERWAKPVRFRETIEKMYADGYRVFLEVGPRGLMTTAVEDTLKGREHAAIALNSIHRRGMLQAQHAFGQLAAIGVKLDISHSYVARRAKKIDFDSALSLEVRKDAEMRLSHALPKLSLLGEETILKGEDFLQEPKARGAKAAMRREAAVKEIARRQRQFDFGAANPLVSDADIVDQTPGISVELKKVFKLSEAPFLADSAFGSSQLSYSDPNLKGLVLLTISAGTEIMAEVARMVVPNRNVIAVDDLNYRRRVAFYKDELELQIHAERVASGDSGNAAVKVQLRDTSKDSNFTWPVMEATFVLAAETGFALPAKVEPLFKPRNVHWSGRDIYPTRVCCGKRLRGIRFVEAWSESGLDYDVEVPQISGAVSFTRFPIWTVNPQLLEVIVSGFALWRSHERFTGAFSFPFRLRRLELRGALPKEGAMLKCYLRLTGVTEESHLCDIVVTDGNGSAIMELSGWEEFTERVPAEYRELVMQPATTFLTQPLSDEVLGHPATDVSSAFITDVPYQLFEKNEALWQKIMRHIVLGAREREESLEKQSKFALARKTEWLFGRIAAKEAVRRFLKDYYQARWSYADIVIWSDSAGKPHALGAWADFLTTKLDIAIAHTAQFVVALAAANAKIGVDVESIGRDLSDEFAEGVFTPEERELAAGAAKASQALIRFWCAKEAVSKALGTGIRYSPKEIVVTDYQSDSGTITVRLEGEWLGQFKNFRGRDIPVSSRVMRDHALAFCFIPATLLPDDEA